MDKNLKLKVESALATLKEYWGDNLKSVYLYGSAARDDWNIKSSDINLLLVTDSNDYSKWPDAAGIARRRIKKAFGLPLILTEDYINTAIDEFPMELLDIIQFHECIHGEDLFEKLAINKDKLRDQVIHEVKGKWIQMRQAALEHGGETIEMRNLLAMSVPFWSALFQAILHVNGKEIPNLKAEVIKNGAIEAEVNSETFLKLLKLRTDKSSLNRTRAWELLIETMTELDNLIKYVDGKFLGNK